MPIVKRSLSYIASSIDIAIMPAEGPNRALVDPFELDEKQQQEARCIQIEKSTLRLDPNRTALIRFAQGFAKRGYERSENVVT